MKVLGGRDLAERLDLLEKDLEPLTRHLEPLAPGVKPDGAKAQVTRRVVGIPDKEAKTRVIAILDFWSQSCLKPVHDFLFQILRQIPQDVTFNQGSFKDMVTKWEAPCLYSVDLTAATDRFPLEVITDVLEGCLSKNRVQAWKDLMIGTPFYVSPTESVNYSVGNPMGAYSSWGSFALAHHFVMYHCCRLSGIAWKDAKYVILGDDVLIGDSRLGETYRSYVQGLGVEVSPSKTLISSELGEFAKRYIYQGVEISPFPAAAVVDGLSDVSLITSALLGELAKGLVPKSGIPGSVSNLFRTMHRRSKACKKAEDHARGVELVTHYLQGTVDSKDLVRGVFHSLPVTDQESLADCSEAILVKGVVLALEQGFSQRGNSLPLLVHKRGREYLRENWGPGSEGQPFLPLMSSPQLTILGRFEEQLTKIERSGLSALRDGSRLPGLLLSEFLVNPLSEASWGLDERRRRDRGVGRLVSAVLKAGREALREGEGVASRARLSGAPISQSTVFAWRSLRTGIIQSAKTFGH